jgi:hypothetical protein
VRYRDDDLCQDMLDLHGMAHNLINQDYSSGTPKDESIGELAERNGEHFGMHRAPRAGV